MSRSFEQPDDDRSTLKDELRMREEVDAREAEEKAARAAVRREKLLKNTWKERIPKTKLPSGEQIDALRNLGVEPLATGYLCSNLMDYILHGNGAGPESGNRFSRTALFNKVQQEWKGKRVRYQNREGVVRFIFPKNIERVVGEVEVKEAQGKSDYSPSPFLATVAFGDSENALEAQTVEIKYLELLSGQEKT